MDRYAYIQLDRIEEKLDFLLRSTGAFEEEKKEEVIEAPPAFEKETKEEKKPTKKQIDARKAASERMKKFHAERKKKAELIPPKPDKNTEKVQKVLDAAKELGLDLSGLKI